MNEIISHESNTFKSKFYKWKLWILKYFLLAINFAIEDQVLISWADVANLKPISCRTYSNVYK